MEKVTAWLSDKKNLPVVVAGFSIVLILAVLFIMKSMGMIGMGGGSQESIPGDMGMPPSQPVSPPVTPQPQQGPTTPGSPGGPPGATAAALPPMLPYRKDPFLPLSGLPTKNDIVALILPSLSRPRIAPAPVRPITAEGGPAVTEVMPPQPFRRMAGVLWNGRVSAILETNGETDIVRPGMEFTRGNSRVSVESVQQDRIVLKTLDTKTPFYITVNMSGAVSGPNAPGSQNQLSGGPSADMYPGG